VAAVVAGHRSGQGVDVRKSPMANPAPEAQSDEPAGASIQEPGGEEVRRAAPFPGPGDVTSSAPGALRFRRSEKVRHGSRSSVTRPVHCRELSNRYGRRFDRHWDFVRYAQQRGLNLDFTTPPKRPDRKLPPLFEE